MLASFLLTQQAAAVEARTGRCSSTTCQLMGMLIRWYSCVITARRHPRTPRSGRHHGAGFRSSRRLHQAADAASRRVLSTRARPGGRDRRAGRCRCRDRHCRGLPTRTPARCGPRRTARAPKRAIGTAQVMRFSHPSDVLSNWLMLSFARHILPAQTAFDLSHTPPNRLPQRWIRA